MQCFDTIAAREISGQLSIEGCTCLSLLATDPGGNGDWAVLDHYAFHQLTSVDARSAMILLEPQSSNTARSSSKNASSIVAVDQGPLLLCGTWKVPLEFESGLRDRFAIAQHIAGAAAMAYLVVRKSSDSSTSAV